MKKTIAIIVLSFLALFGCTQTPATSSTAPMTSRELVKQCTTDMATTYHVHSHLTIEINKTFVTVPAKIGIKGGCMSAVHTHDDSGVIHIESPVKENFTLGDFFYNWKQSLSKDQVMDSRTDFTHRLKMFVNGKESTDFENLVLSDNEDIFLDYYSVSDGPDAAPQAFDFSAHEL